MRAFKPVLLILTVTGGLAALPTAVTVAQDAKPVPCGDKLAFTDKVDQDNVQVPEGDRTGSTEVLGGFLSYDAAKGDDALTYNVVVQKLTAEVPGGYTTISWNAYFNTADGAVHFVRALHDFGGTTVFEYGSFTENPTGAGLTGVSTYGGVTKGKLFEGDNGIVQIVVPKALAPAGQTITNLYASSGQGRTLPASFPGYSRGLSSVMDTAPDAGSESSAKFKIEACATAAAAPVKAATGTAAALGVKLASKTAKAPKSKSLALKLKAAKPLTKVTVRLKSGKATVGKGTLATLSGSGTVKLKLSRALKPGKHAVEVVATQADGTRGTATLALTIKK